MRSCKWHFLVAITACWLLLTANARAEFQKFILCEEKFPGNSKEIRDQRYKCFEELSSSKISDDYHLDRLWPTHSESSGIVAYKQNYLLLSNTDVPNREPTSPNIRNQVTPTYRYEAQEVKFQFSLKTQYPHPDWLGHANSLWFGYTQQSHWQVTNGANSWPFRENNYEVDPLIFSHQFEKRQVDDNWAPRFLNFGIVHQSNGQVLPYSRSWNRAYMQAGVEKKLSGSSNIAVVLRPWLRIAEVSASDDNPDITDYLGYGDLELLYWNGKQMLSALVKSRSLQLDWSMPMPMGESTPKSLHLHLQYFTGYGESLIDYNQQHSVVGIGVSLPYDLDANSK